MNDIEHRVCDAVLSRPGMRRFPISKPEYAHDAILNRSLTDLGLESLELVEAVMDCEQHYHVEISDDVLHMDLTAAMIAAEILKLLNQHARQRRA